MTNPKWNFNIITPEHIATLSKVVDDKTHMDFDIMHLFRRGLVESSEVGLARFYCFKKTPRGMFALRGIYRDARIKISDSYKLPFMRGKTGTVLDVHDAQIDADGFDQYGYQDRWSTKISYAQVAVDDQPGEWCFYHPTDLAQI